MALDEAFEKLNAMAMGGHDGPLTLEDAQTLVAHIVDLRDTALAYHTLVSNIKSRRKKAARILSDIHDLIEQQEERDRAPKVSQEGLL